MPQDNVKLLRDAIGRNCGLVVSLPNAMGLLRHHKSRFLAQDAAGFWIESVPADRELVDELIGSGRQAGVSFKAGDTKVIFASPILRRETNYPINADLIAEAVLIKQPTDVKTIQRRTNYRAVIVPDSDLAIRVWRIGRCAYLKDRPATAQEIPTRLRDLSTGGMGVTFLAKDGQPPRVASEDRLRIQLTLPGGGQLLIEGRLRYPAKLPTDAIEVRAGIQFKQLNGDLEDRLVIATLTKIVGEMQRAEARRYRLGIA